VSAARSERILVVDDSPDTLEVLARTLGGEGYEVVTAKDAREAITLLESGPVDLVVTDFRMPGVDGIDLTRHVRENHRDTEVVVITGYGSIDNAVGAMKAGAGDYLPKPFTDGELTAAVERCLERRADRRLDADRREAGRGPGVPRAPQGLIGQSTLMGSVFALVEKAAAVSAPVLLTGESGTGKEMVARAVHYSGPRASAPFVAVNCGAIPEQLIESELFGYLRGSFTGADQTRAGYFQTAERGTIFLDEVAETSPAMQVKLLRVVQDREIAMIGSRKTITVDVRIIAATNTDLADLVRRGLFREDLYYRLAVITIGLPPLRDRGDDLFLLASHFAARYAREYGKEQPRLSDSAVEALRRYSWPGNVRELENTVQRLVLMCDHSVIDAPDLPDPMRFSVAAGPALGRPLAAVEAEYVSAVLASVGGNRSRAAKILGIDRKTLAARLSRRGTP
jgi:two-component system, NtrC family, response regulator HydG